MRVVKLLMLFILGVVTSVVIAAEKAYAWSWGKKDPSQVEYVSDRIINDSLVQNLSCQKLGVNSIYSSIRDDAFKTERHMPITNWWFKADFGVDLGVCWALSSTQRMFYYLARFNEPNTFDTNKRLQVVLDMVRQSTPSMVVGKNGSESSKKIREFPFKDLIVFPYAGDSFRVEYKQNTPDLWASLLLEGYVQRLEDGTLIPRSLVRDLQVNQTSRFFRFGNLHMVGGSRERGLVEDEKTLRLLLDNLDNKKLTLLNLRPGRMKQHVVLAKSYTVNSKGDVIIRLYDSDRYRDDLLLTYRADTRQFYLPRIVGWSDDESAPLGVFIVSEEEREPIEAALMKYYTELCRK